MSLEQSISMGAPARSRRRAVLLALTLAIGAAAPAAAQQQSGAADVASPYDEQLTRLIEVLGSVQFLRQLCNPDEGVEWRERAASLVEAEGTSEARRGRLTASFNRGYRAFASYSECTDAAIFALDRYMREGERLGREILVRYGN